MMPDIVIVDYQLSNLFNVKRACHALGFEAVISSDVREVCRAGRLILPGVGAFGEGMKNLRDMGLDEVIKKRVHDGVPLLGICLGMQMLLSESYEFGKHEGLGLIEGSVVPLQPLNEGDQQFKVPQVGWNSIFIQQTVEKGLWSMVPLVGVKEKTYMYFVHSFCAKVKDPEDCLAETDYGGDRFSSVVRKGCVVGCQFHPERSGRDGLKILKNFLEWKV